MMSVWADIYTWYDSLRQTTLAVHTDVPPTCWSKKNLILWGAANQKKGSLKGGGRELEMASSLSYTPRIKRNMSLFPFKVDHLPLLAAHHSRWYASISPYPYILLCHSSLPYILFYFLHQLSPWSLCFPSPWQLHIQHALFPLRQMLDIKVALHS